MLEGHTDSVLTVHETKDGSKIISGSADTTIRVWNINTGKTLGLLKGHTNSILSVCSTNDGRKLISGSDDYTIRIWDLKNFK